MNEVQIDGAYARESAYMALYKAAAVDSIEPVARLAPASDANPTPTARRPSP